VRRSAHCYLRLELLISGLLNEQSLQAANAFLAAAAASTETGALLARSPAEIGKEAGLANPLAVARAIRALAARRRLQVEDGRYRLLDPRPLDPGEPESVPRAPRKRKGRRATRAETADRGDRRPTYADLGRAVVERVIELGREAGEAVAAADHLRRDAKENKATRIEADQRASRLFDRVKELETKLEMAEANLRTVLAAARGRGATASPSSNEMEALLRILKAPSGGEAPPADGPPPAEAASSADVAPSGNGIPEPQEAAGE
jgi:hypothetical protein